MHSASLYTVFYSIFYLFTRLEFFYLMTTPTLEFPFGIKKVTKSVSDAMYSMSFIHPTLFFLHLKFIWSQSKYRSSHNSEMSNFYMSGGWHQCPLTVWQRSVAGWSAPGCAQGNDQLVGLKPSGDLPAPPADWPDCAHCPQSPTPINKRILSISVEFTL